jgi:hypothetical protein
VEEGPLVRGRERRHAAGTCPSCAVLLRRSRGDGGHEEGEGDLGGRREQGRRWGHLGGEGDSEEGETESWLRLGVRENGKGKGTARCLRKREE